MDIASVLVRVALIWTVAAVTPGPNFIITAHVSASTSARIAGFAALGIVTGTAIWGSSGALGIHLLFSHAPWTYGLMKIVGGGYLVSIGLRLILTNNRANGANCTSSKGRVGALEAWRLGLLTNLSNPKTALFTASLFAINMPADPPLWLSVAAVAIMLTVSLIWYGAVACFFGTASMTRNYRRNSLRINRVAGWTFIIFGFILIGQDYVSWNIIE